MPIKVHKNDEGYFIQWGEHGAKYYFNPNSQRSYELAHKKAIKQMVAAMYHGYKPKSSKY